MFFLFCNMQKHLMSLVLQFEGHFLSSCQLLHYRNKFPLIDVFPLAGIKTMQVSYCVCVCVCVCVFPLQVLVCEETVKTMWVSYLCVSPPPILTVNSY